MAFCDLLETYFNQAANAEGVVRKALKIAGQDVTLQFAGEATASLMSSALAHLEVSGPMESHDGLTISMWNGARAPSNYVLRAYLYTLANWWFSYIGPRGELVDIHGGDVLATYIPDTRLMSVVDLAHNRAFYWKSDTSDPPYYESCSPFRTLLHGWMRSRGRHFVHGAAVGYADGGVMMVGKGGSGKSTSALSCLSSSLQYAGDDYCIVSGNKADGYEIHSLYCTAKLVEERNLEAFPDLAGNVLNPERVTDEKVALSLYGFRSSKLLRQFPLRAILLPVITGGGETSILPCSAHDAMMALAPTSVSQLPFSDVTDLRYLAEVTRSVPTYRLLLGTRLDEVPLKIEELLRSLRVQTPREESVHATSNQ